MLLSQVLNKKSLAANVRPSFLRAWTPVLIDLAIILTVLALLFLPILTFIYATQPSDAATGFFLFVLYVATPLAVLWNAGRWAYRVRKRY